MKGKVKKILLTALRFVPLVVCLACMVAYLLSGQELSAEALLNFAPERPLFAALFLLLLYAFKSLTVVFPITVLILLGGFLFDPFYALLVNLLGLLVELSIPYCIGKLSGAGLADRFLARYPKLSEALHERNDSNLFRAFFLRVISCLPMDVVGMYFGAARMPFGVFLLGSFLGMLPGTIAKTLLGTSITEPTSPLFWVSVGLIVSISVLSFLANRLWKKKQRRSCSGTDA